MSALTGSVSSQCVVMKLTKGLPYLGLISLPGTCSKYWCAVGKIVVSQYSNLCLRLPNQQVHLASHPLQPQRLTQLPLHSRNAKILERELWLKNTRLRRAQIPSICSKVLQYTEYTSLTCTIKGHSNGWEAFRILNSPVFPGISSKRRTCLIASSGFVTPWHPFNCVPAAEVLCCPIPWWRWRGSVAGVLGAFRFSTVRGRMWVFRT